ncbi:MAG TPA: NUDIX hydrolase [Thermomicrobiales bacterium]|nr:NUDIX hydrolase [Thermomicrobiales bacterium]
MPLSDLTSAEDLPHEVRTGSEIIHDIPFGSRTGSETIYDASWLRFRIDDVRLPSGRASQRAVVERPKSVVIVPVTVDGEVLLIRQYRYAAGQHLIELPAGLIDPGEDALTTARRELIEETGHEPGTLRILATVFMSPGYTDEQTTFVLAEGCSPVEHEPDPDEPIRVAKIPLAEVTDLLIPGDMQVIQAQAMLGLMWLLRMYDQDSR